MVRLLSALALMTIVFWGCEDEMNKTGHDLLLPGDLVSAHKQSIDKASFQAYTVRDEKLRTNKPEYNLLGTFNDPVFGKTTSDFAAQFRMNEVPNFANILFDKLELKLLYIESYGDTVTPQNLKVYELQSDLDAEDTTRYYQDIELKSLAKTEVIGQVTHKAKKLKLYYNPQTTNPASTKETPKDTVIHEIVFPLSASLAQKLMAVDLSPDPNNPNPQNPNDKFIRQFKGLYIEADNTVNQGGGLMRIRANALDSHMRMYYHKPNDTTQYFVEYRMTSSAARVNRFVHDYSTTAFAASLDQMTQQDSLIYLQTTGGLSSKIKIPSLSNWKDSSDVAVNKAELIFKIEPAYLDTVLYPAPPKLILSLMDENGKVFNDRQQLIFPSDLSFSEAYYGGIYNKKDGTYRFNLAKHMQQIIKGEIKNNGFYLTTDNKNAIYNRAVLKGATSKTGIRFEITYTKIK